MFSPSSQASLWKSEGLCVRVCPWVHVCTYMCTHLLLLLSLALLSALSVNSAMVANTEHTWEHGRMEKPPSADRGTTQAGIGVTHIRSLETYKAVCEISERCCTVPLAYFYIHMEMSPDTLAKDLIGDLNYLRIEMWLQRNVQQTWPFRKVWGSYSTFGKYSEPLTFSTLCYFTALF
jgi:hypothetical protein